MRDRILHRVADGEASAVRELIDRYGGLVYSLARRFSFDPGEVEDAVQEVFIALWKCADRFNESIGSEETFVAMVARRRLIDRRRRTQRRNQGMVDADVTQVPAPLNGTVAGVGSHGPGVGSPSADVSEQAQRATELLSTLRPEQQQVIRMSIVQGMSHDEISKATGMPLGTVKTHVRRGLMALREAMQPSHTNKPQD